MPGLRELLAQGQAQRYVYPGVPMTDYEPMGEQMERLFLLRDWIQRQTGEPVPPPFEPMFPRELERMQEEERLRRLNLEAPTMQAKLLQQILGLG